MIRFTVFAALLVVRAAGAQTSPPAAVDTAATDPVAAPLAPATADTVPASGGAAFDSAGETAAGRTSPVRALAEVGSAYEERLRLAQLAGAAPADGFLLRSASTLTPRRAGAYLALLLPRAELGWNTRIPHSVNDGPLWAGKGGSSRVLAGLEAAAGPLRIVLAPEFVWQQNQAFDGLLPETWDADQRATFTAPWLIGPHSVDLPYRFGEGSRTEVLPGESSATLALGPVEAGVATESQWWGPGVRSALLLSNQAGGFPHALLRTSRPLRTPLGGVEGRWILGRLSSSDFDTASLGGHRSLSAATLVLTPRAGLSIGAARVVYQPLDGHGLASDAADVLTRWSGAGDTAVAEPFEQMTSVFGRWVLSPTGAEVYAEWGRRRLPTLRSLLERPEDTQGYTVGAAWARRARGDARIRLSGEATYLEKSPTYRAFPLRSWYAGRAVPQGYTHRGQVLGAYVGPGGSGQWVAADWIAPRAQFGVALTRVRWANDAYYDQPDRPNPSYRSHDVSVLGTLRGGGAVGPLWLEAEWTAGRRYNFLFQNTSRDFTEQELSVSPFNQTLRLRISFLPPLPSSKR